MNKRNYKSNKRNRAGKLSSKPAFVVLIAIIAVILGVCAISDPNYPSDSNTYSESQNLNDDEFTQDDSSNEQTSDSEQIENEEQSERDEQATNDEQADGTDKSVVVSDGTELRVRFIDVGQGDATIISCGNHHMIIDGGPSSASQKMYSILKTLKIKSLDCIIASHPDADHIGGISGALNYAKTSVLYCSTTTHDTKTFNNMVKYAEKTSGVDITVPTVGDSFMLGEAKVTFVGPTSTFDDSNDSSLVVRIDFGSTSFLFTGDAETDSESSMISHKAHLAADVIKVAHHGSKSSSSLAFLKKVSPSYAVISVGAENSYGHPTSVVLKRLSSLGIKTLRTDELGHIIFVSDGSNLTYSYTTGKITE